jgi:IS30 family transposase
MRGGYHATHAAVIAKERRNASKQAMRKIENNAVLSKRIEEMLHPLVSPEVIAHEIGLVHETIYTWIARSRPDLYPRLPQHGRKRRRYGSKRIQKQGWTRDVRSIDERPHTDVFSWEGDTMKGGSRARLLTHVERTSLFTIVDLIPDGTANTIYARIADRAIFSKSYLTYDRGSEFALWRMIERDTKATVYFAHAHAPWERGKNENTNGRLRRVFPKRFNFSTITQRDVNRVVWLMNHTPRKSLSWRTPAEVFKKMRCTSD